MNAVAEQTAPAATQPTLPVIPGTECELGFYVGRVRGFNGEPAADIVLLPGSFHGTHADAMKWAEEQGGVLPDRREGALLYANAHDQFETDDAYWLRTSHADYSDYAWFQWFGSGGQDGYRKSGGCHARAVRRFSVI